jgi:hypothetical protein
LDFVSLKDDPALDNKLADIFSHKELTIVGFAFNSDVEQFARKFPNLKFFRYI